MVKTRSGRGSSDNSVQRSKKSHGPEAIVDFHVTGLTQHMNGANFPEFTQQEAYIQDANENLA